MQIEKVSDEYFIEMLDYMAWCIRANCFKGNFVEKFKTYGMENFGWNEPYAIVEAHRVFEWVNEQGLIYAFQNLIQDEEGKRALVHAIKI